MNLHRSRPSQGPCHDLPWFPELCCPLCNGDLLSNEDAYACTACDRTYPVVLGIPDFRVFPDPWIDIHDDHQKGRFLASNASDMDFENLVRFYWITTPNVPEKSVERFTRHAISLDAKWRSELPGLEHRIGTSPGSVLDVGCGTAGFVTAAARAGHRVVGVDLAFRWLVVARKRLDEADLDVPLVCACAEALPFRDDQFDLVFGEAVVEHLRDQSAALADCARVATEGGHLYLRTTNRFSMAPEPHVGVWGVGFLPRKWMPPFVRMIKGVPYPFLRLVSRRELGRLLERAGVRSLRFTLPDVSTAEGAYLGRLGRAVVRIYRHVRTIRALASLLTWVYPILEVSGRIDSTPKTREPRESRHGEPRSDEAPPRTPDPRILPSTIRARLGP